jgi:integrase
MAHLFQKQDGSNYQIKFRYEGDYYKRSLKTADPDQAAIRHLAVDLMIRRLAAGEIEIPTGVDPGGFIVSEGKNRKPTKKITGTSSFSKLVEFYLESQSNRISPNYRSSQKTHLGHLAKSLGAKGSGDCNRITEGDLDKFIEQRLKIRDANTVIRERCTLRQFFGWALEKKHIQENPAASLETIKGGRDLQPFRTRSEIEAMIERGGLDDLDDRELWERLFLDTNEVAGVLDLVRRAASLNESFFLHAIPAYTGMRRGELLKLKWLDVDFDGETITARSRKQSRSKEETSRTIDLHPELRDELSRWRKQQQRGQYVLCDPSTLEPIEKDRANRLFWQPMRGTEWCLAGKRNWFKIGFHTYRHSFASNLAARGIDQRIIDEFMGHQTEAMRRRYRHLFPNNRREAMQSFSLVCASTAGK